MKNDERGQMHTCVGLVDRLYFRSSVHEQLNLLTDLGILDFVAYRINVFFESLDLFHQRTCKHPTAPYSEHNP